MTGAPALPSSLPRRRPDRRRSFFALLCLLLAWAAPCVGSAAEDDAPPAIIKKVVVEGNKLIETQTIVARLQTVEGSAFDPEVVSEDIRSLYGLGYFDDIQVSAAGFEGGLAVTFTVREKRLISRVEFRGNQEVESDDLREKVEQKSNAVVNEYDIKISVERLLALLHEKGYYQASVDWRLEDTGENESALVFIVTEGQRLWVRTIDIRGNEQLSDEEIKDVMQTKEKGLFSFFTKSGTLIAQQLDDDALRILALFYNSGFLQARVEPPTVEMNQELGELRVVINVHEGLRYSIGTLTAPDDTGIPSADILATMQTKPGEVFRRETFSRDINAITALYTDIGHAFCRVDAATDLDPAARLVNIQMIIVPGPLVRVGRISITGNQITRDNVIRREVVVHEGEYFSSKRLARSRQRIMNLGFFDKVDVTTEPRGEETIDVRIEVVERLTGTLSFGAGYSTDDKFGFVFKLTQDNLFGWGHKVQASAEIDATDSDFNIYYYNPAVRDSAYSAGLRIYNTTADYDEYDRQNTGGSLTLGRGLGEYWRCYVTYKDERVEVTNLADDVSSYIKSQEGVTDTSMFSLMLTRDSRNHFFTPTSGSRLQMRGDLAGGFLGGDNYFYRYTLEGIQYFPIWKQLTFSVHGEWGEVRGFSGHDVPIYEHFFVGGSNSVRGFEQRGIGPVDENGDPVGGYTELILNTELVFPLIPQQQFMGVVFYDAGQAWDKYEAVAIRSLRTSFGGGFRWLSPIGPFRIEWGFVINPKPDEPHSQWHFSIGSMF